jgi:hypothetical protein
MELQSWASVFASECAHDDDASFKPKLNARCIPQCCMRLLVQDEAHQDLGGPSAALESHQLTVTGRTVTLKICERAAASPLRLYKAVNCMSIPSPYSTLASPVHHTIEPDMMMILQLRARGWNDKRCQRLEQAHRSMQGGSLPE